jgi:membrane-bound hydrogenase subunit beta
MTITTEKALEAASELFEHWVWKTQTERPEPNRLDVYIRSSEDLIPMTVGLRVQRLGYLAAISGLDLGPESGECELLYHFCTAAAIITLRLRIPREGTVVPSLCSIIPSAEVFEREASEMFGITFHGLKNPDHLYLPDDWPEKVYPLLKDFNPEVLKTLQFQEHQNGT